MADTKALKISTKLLLLVGVFGLGFAAFSFLTYRTIETVKVNGPVYRNIVQGKDLIADILPPPAYIIESYLLVHEMAIETDGDAIDRMIEKSRALRREYEARHAFWIKDLDEGAMKQTFLVRSYEPALTFFDLRDREFIPAVRAGDKAKIVEVRARLKAPYEEHRKQVDEVVKMATEWNVRQEASASAIASANGSSLFGLGVGIFAIVLVIGWLGSRFAASITRRISMATDAATKVASGDLSVAIGESSHDETGQLLGAVGTMTKNLSSLVARVKQSSIDIMATANEMGTTSKQQETTVQGFGASTSQIAAAVKEISATGQELLSTMNAVSAAAAEAASSAEQGRQGLEGMNSTMHQLASSTGSISSKLSAIREKANDINLAVTTITKVADQTNLLSVNAAIEAEKAGEYGLGFLVLAREIRRLADQTAVATLDIDKMVREMHGAVSAGVMEMDKFSEEVRRGVSGVSQIGGDLGRIISGVATLSHRFEAVNDGMRMQSQGAGQIDQAMAQLISGARQTAGSLREFNNATDNLRGAVDGLRQEIAQFRVAN